jgi:hypothetical protein
MLREKLLSGKLDKHSEQLNKFLAGFFDSDGSIFLYKDRDHITIRATIAQSASKDPDFEIMRALKNHYKLGSLIFYIQPLGSSMCAWNLGKTDSLKLFGLIGKYLCIKGTYFKYCIDCLSSKEFDKGKQKVNRIESIYLKKPKHLSWSYLAGLIAGDGHLQFKKYNGHNKINVCIASGDFVIIDLLMENFKGHYQQQDGCYIWRHPLGKSNKPFAINFLRRIRKFMLLNTKRDVIDRILAFHKVPAETERINCRDTEATVQTLN